MTTATPASTRTAAGRLTLVGLHARLHVLQTVRVPFVVVSLTAFPVMAFLFFVLPRGGTDVPITATESTAQLALFSMTSVCLFSFGAGVADERALPWDASLRVLPAGPGPRLVGRLLAGLVLSLLGLFPLLVASALTTAATLPMNRWLPAVLALMLASAPLLAMGLTIGYTLPAKAAVAAAQMLLLPLAFAGGLFLPPQVFPAWLNTISRALPTRAGRDVVIAAATGGEIPLAGVLVLAAWLIVLATTAICSYRRDEGARYR